MSSPHTCAFSSISPIGVSLYVLVLRKDDWRDFSLVKFSKPGFVTWDVLYPGACSLCA